MLEELCKRIQHCCATLRWSRNKSSVGRCGLKSLTGFKFCATTCNRVCKLTQHVTSNNAGSCLLTVLRPTANNKIQDIQQPDEYETDSDNESDEEGDFEVVYGRTCMTRSGRSVRDHDWCVWVYEAGVILMVIRLNLICTYDSKNRLREVLIVIAYPFLLLRLDNYVLFYFLHVLINCTSGWVYVNSPGDIHFWI